MLGIPLGLAASNATEWLIHKYVLHGLGQKKGSFWSFHWHDHHKNVRRNDHVDPDYEHPLFRPWHYDHHMGPNQHANWCVTRPWFDQLMGTREPYVGTEREQRDLERRARRVTATAAAS